MPGPLHFVRRKDMRKIRRVVKEELEHFGFSNPFKCRTINFSDLARDSAIFVTIERWSPDACAVDLSCRISKRCLEELGEKVIVEFAGAAVTG